MSVPEDNLDGSKGGIANGYAGVMREALVAGNVAKMVDVHVSRVFETIEQEEGETVKSLLCGGL